MKGTNVAATKQRSEQTRLSKLPSVYSSKRFGCNRFVNQLFSNEALNSRVCHSSVVEVS